MIPKLEELLQTDHDNQIEIVELKLDGPVVEEKPQLRVILQVSSENNDGTGHYKTCHQKSDFKQIISELMGSLQNLSDRESLRAVNKNFYKVSLKNIFYRAKAPPETGQFHVLGHYRRLTS